ncbi:HAD family hydrolase [Halalkalibacillus halophilus]|uniref:HAD family hydrolase n=1 Tax=Halalkalibacillus halophilus TaxID=392827 RepID=UPI000429C6F9|nr:HAD family hydrolase [Halalkalibacillus halophilus]
MIRSIIFDLDGTLLDRNKSLRKFLESQYERLRSNFSHIPKEDFASRFIQLDDNGYVWKDVVYQSLIKEFNITKISWEALVEDYLNHFPSCCVPYPNLEKTLSTLKDHSIKLGIITNGKYPFQLNNIKALGIESYFDEILISEQEGIKKPDPLIFQRALQRLNVTPEETMFVGDHLINDVGASSQIGVKSVWKRNGSNESSCVADFVIDDLSEFLALNLSGPNPT